MTMPTKTRQLRLHTWENPHYPEAPEIGFSPSVLPPSKPRGDKRLQSTAETKSSKSKHSYCRSGSIEVGIVDGVLRTMPGRFKVVLDAFLSERDIFFSPR